MKLATKIDSLEELKTNIKERFAEFNRNSVASTGRQYPKDLRALIIQGHIAGLKRSALNALSGMSTTAISYAIKSNKVGSHHPKSTHIKKTPRRLEVVADVLPSRSNRNPLVIRLPSGVILELADETLLTPSLIHTLTNVEVHHAPSR